MKAHLKTSDSPLTQGQTETADCGAIVLRAKHLFFWDESAMRRPLMYSIGQVCQKCARTSTTGVYVYGISEQGEEPSDAMAAAVERAGRQVWIVGGNNV